MTSAGSGAGALPPGHVRRYYGDLASGELHPDRMRIDNLTFRAVIDRAGLVLAQTPKISIVSQYQFALRRVFASMVHDELDGGSSDLLQFNVREQGRGFDVFKKPISFAAALRLGPIEHDGTYICIAGTDLEVTWTVDVPLWQSLVDATRIVKVTLSGDYVSCSTR
ncbi:hypothetical protein [Sandaracinus amylolyticus]|uniref:Uncharacterized protein n=1 Tax=Sandaracinus amylolyticus TaxID=927083 RepID=A0A0F6YGY4_9BACT|nr:hypothetical protein [Sandaracinus amylolyticus]AKF03395.1 hypothetical protein DB32_000544 [Sandaracinus amylolyticus]